MGRIRLGETHTKADGFLHIKESTACTDFIFKRWFNTGTEKSQDPGYQAVNQNEEHHGRQMPGKENVSSGELLDTST